MANGYFNFPHTRTYDSDLGWLIKAYVDVQEKLDRYLETSTITFADPITWDITAQYTALTCVVDRDGTAYLSKQPVPAGIAITNTSYWLPIFNYDDNINQLRSQIAYNAGSMDTITVDLSAGDLVFWAGYIYTALYDLTAGARLIEGVNVERYTVDDKINALKDDMTGDIAALNAALDEERANRISGDQALTAAVSAEVAARLAEDQALADSIAAEASARETAITALRTALHAEIETEAAAREAADANLAADIATEESARELADADLQAQIDAIGPGLTDDKFVLIGDSYGRGDESSPNGWAVQFKALYGLTEGVDAFTSTVGGATMRLDMSNNFRANMIALAGAMTQEQRESITKVLICGGANDSGTGADAIAGHAISTAEQARTLFPNAHIYLGMICAMTANQFYALNAPRIADGYKRAAGCVKDCSYLDNVEYNMHMRAYMQPDGVHLSTAGYTVMTRAIIAAMLGGYSFGYQLRDILTAPSGGTYNTTPGFNLYIDNDTASLKLHTMIDITFATNQSWGYGSSIKVGSIPSAAMLGVAADTRPFNTCIAACDVMIGVSSVQSKISAIAWIDAAGNIYVQNRDAVTSSGTSVINSFNRLQVVDLTIISPTISC